MTEIERLRVDRFVYGGYGFARPEEDHEAGLLISFTLPGEVVEVERAGPEGEPRLVRIVEPSAARVEPGCPHFGICGGCHLQMASYEEQLRLKQEVLLDALRRAGVTDVPATVTHAGEPWGYRNRIRLHVVREGDRPRLGYRERKSSAVLPIATCPIAAPLLWETAEAVLALAERDTGMSRWLRASDEVEMFCDDSMSRVQLSLLCSGRVAALPRGSFERAMTALQATQPALVGAGAARVHPRTGQIQQEIAAWGSAGLHYEAAGERYWVARGSFFQVNRFLLGPLVDLVCAGRGGRLAWDLFAGVGLFARVLADSFERVTAVEANPGAAAVLRAAFERLGPQHAAIQTVMVEFLLRAVVERDRPELVVLDPPRAGAGGEACELLARIAPGEIVYVSCDPVTLARDLAVLESGYAIAELHLVDLFPQTYHQEAVVFLQRRS
ncbi:MAG TPA: 23S rRNA (uracil(1939)-C(5))-methyltransferase RlmD [Acidobacteriaceae bacterium]|nr:23S rRNA (uracil(1939)-C(5))-methyltransferase RlmD [Acidobacteriaceae bacterium]